MSLSILSNPQIKQLLNIASISDLPTGASSNALTSINTGTTNSPNSSGLTTSIASGVATLTNTTSYYYDLGATTNTRNLYPNQLNQYINVYSRSANAPTPCTFNFAIAGAIPVGSFISIHIDAGVLSTDVFVIQAGTGTTTSPPATGPGNITCTAGTTYTFVCFQLGMWTRM